MLLCTYTVTVAYYLSQSEIGTRFSNLLSNVSYKQLDIVSRRRYKTTDLTTLSVAGVSVFCIVAQHDANIRHKLL